ncbi:MAG TPA: hypothetical protein VGP16_15660 [Asanoa sp.]|nr:hypothetical protein [Asanoa sp.]
MAAGRRAPWPRLPRLSCALAVVAVTVAAPAVAAAATVLALRRVDTRPT